MCIFTIALDAGLVSRFSEHHTRLLVLCSHTTGRQHLGTVGQVHHVTFSESNADRNPAVKQSTSCTCNELTL